MRAGRPDARVLGCARVEQPVEVDLAAVGVAEQVVARRVAARARCRSRRPSSTQASIDRSVTPCVGGGATCHARRPPRRRAARRSAPRGRPGRRWSWRIRARRGTRRCARRPAHRRRRRCRRRRPPAATRPGGLTQEVAPLAVAEDSAQPGVGGDRVLAGDDRAREVRRRPARRPPRAWRRGGRWPASGRAAPIFASASQPATTPGTVTVCGPGRASARRRRAAPDVDAARRGPGGHHGVNRAVRVADEGDQIPAQALLVRVGDDERGRRGEREVQRVAALRGRRRSAAVCGAARAGLTPEALDQDGAPERRLAADQRHRQGGEEVAAGRDLGEVDHLEDRHARRAEDVVHRPLGLAGRRVDRQVVDPDEPHAALDEQLGGRLLDPDPRRLLGSRSAPVEFGVFSSTRSLSSSPAAMRSSALTSEPSTPVRSSTCAGPTNTSIGMFSIVSPP